MSGDPFVDDFVNGLIGDERSIQRDGLATHRIGSPDYVIRLLGQDGRLTLQTHLDDFPLHRARCARPMATRCEGERILPVVNLNIRP